VDAAVDNLMFLNDQKIYSAAITDFIEKLLAGLIKLEHKSNYCFNL
jgi:hypothetical protein